MHLILRSSTKTPELLFKTLQLLHAEKIIWDGIHSRQLCNFSALLPSGVFQDAMRV